jgi:hypothetical protein
MEHIGSIRSRLYRAASWLKQALQWGSVSKEPSPISWRELIPLLGLLIPLVFVRLWRLEQVPSNVTGDEVEFLNDVLRALHHGMGFFALAGDGSQPANNFYYMAGFVKLLGENNAIVAMRISSGVMSLLGIVAFYFYLRLKAEPWPSLLATALLGTNFVFLNFSRGSWINAGTISLGILSFLLLELALAKRRLWLSGAAGFAAACAVYGYAAGRVFPLASLAYLGYLGLRRRLQWRTALAHGLVFNVVLLLVFLPQLVAISQDFERYTLRARTTFIGDESSRGAANVLLNKNFEEPYYGETDMKGILWHQVTYSTRGFVFLDPAVGGEGRENARYGPVDEAPVDVVTRILFFLGMAAVLFVHRRDIVQPTIAFLGTIVGLEIMTTLPPSYARGLFLLPFVYLLVGLLLDKAWSLPWTGNLGRAIIVVGVALVALFNVHHYFDWGTSAELAAARWPSIQYEEVPLWVETEKQNLREGKPDLHIHTEQWQNLIKNPPIQNPR